MDVSLVYTCVMYILSSKLKDEVVNAENLPNRTETRKPCQNGTLFSEGQSARIFRGKIKNIAVANTSGIGNVELLFVKNNTSCCPQVLMEDCTTSYQYELTLCNRTRQIQFNFNSSINIPGNTYIISLGRNDSCNTIVGIVLQKVGIKTISSSSSQLYSSQRSTIGEVDILPATPTMALTSIAPVTYGQNDSTITPIISMTPTQVDISIQELLTTRYSTRRGIDFISTLAPTNTRTDEESRKKKTETIALGITIAIFAIAVIVIGSLIVRVIYKTRRDIHVKADKAVFCTNEFVHSPGFINEASSAITKPEFINIRKVSDSDTDEMMEIKHATYQNRTYADTYLGISSKTEKEDNRETGLSSYKKYPAPHPSKASNYVSNKNSRLLSHQSDRNYYNCKH